MRKNDALRWIELTLIRIKDITTSNHLNISSFLFLKKENYNKFRMYFCYIEKDFPKYFQKILDQRMSINLDC